MTTQSSRRGAPPGEHRGRSQPPLMLSVVVPVYNEREVLSCFVEATERVLQNLGLGYEFVFVDDGSRDGSDVELARLQSLHPCIRVVTLTRNFGKEAALTAGLKFARGNAVIPMDADLQDPPDVIPQLVRAWRQGYRVVDTVRRSRDDDSWAKRITAKLFYALFRRIASPQLPPDAGDFRLLDRQAVNALLQYPERIRFLKGMMASLGFERAVVEYDRPVRAAGTTKWNYWRLWNFALDGITGFSTFPLRIWTYIGLGVAVWSAGYAGWVVTKQLLYGGAPAGYSTMLTVTLFMNGIQMVGLGIIGEYVGRIVVEVKERPLYLVANVHPHDDATVGGNDEPRPL